MVPDNQTLSDGDRLVINKGYGAGNPNRCELKGEIQANESFKQAAAVGTERACRSACDAWPLPNGSWKRAFFYQFEKRNWICQLLSPEVQ